MLGLVVILAGCQGPMVGPAAPSASQQDGPPLRAHGDLSKIPDPVPRREPQSKRGNPRTYTVFGKTYQLLDTAEGYDAKGNASWYGRKFHGRTTSSGEPFDMFQLTAAHRSLPIPTYARVTNLNNGQQIVVRINDRGPFHDNRIIDLSYAAAVKLGFHDQGTAPVHVQVVAAAQAPQSAQTSSGVTTSAAAAGPTSTPGSVLASPFPVPLPDPQPDVGSVSLVVPSPAATAVAPSAVTAAAGGPVAGSAGEGAAAVFLQAGAFSGRDSALRRALAIQQHLANLSVDARTEVVSSAADPLFRVRIGPVLGRAEAQRIRDLIARDFARPLILP